MFGERTQNPSVDRPIYFNSSMVPRVVWISQRDSVCRSCTIVVLKCRLNNPVEGTIVCHADQECKQSLVLSWKEGVPLGESL